MPAPLRFCGRTCETFVLMVTVHCSWWTGVLKLRDALLSSVYKQLGSVIWPSLGSFLFHGVPWECARSKFWIQGVELAVLMLFQRCFYCDWIVIGCGQGFTWEKSPCPQYFFYLMLSDFFFMIYSVICGEMDGDIWLFCLEHLLILSSSVMSIQI